MTEGRTVRRTAKQKDSLQRLRLRGVVLACLVGTSCLVATIALAQDVSLEAQPETLFDVIKTPPDRLVPQARDDDARSADALFNAAMTELQGARFDEARRLFELFVVRDPQHQSVAEARRHLSELYQIDSKAVLHGGPAETAAMPDVEPVMAPVVPVAARVVATPQLGTGITGAFGSCGSGTLVEAECRLVCGDRRPFRRSRTRR
jgi:hypothetical protein